MRVGNFSMRFNHRQFERGERLVHVFQGTWEPFVPPGGQRLFGDTSFGSRLRNALERRMIRGGTTMEIALAGPGTDEEAATALQRQFERLIADGPAGK